MSLSAREAAVMALQRQRRYNSWISDVLLSFASLSSGDAALASAISLGVLQNAALLDFYINSFLLPKTKKINPYVRDILRVSAYQILFMDKIPHSAAINEGVKLCKKRCEFAGGLCNAVLRKISESSDNMPEVPGAGTAEFLSTRYSHPIWIITELIDAIGYDAAEKILIINNSPSPITIQPNTLKTTGEELIASLGANELGASNSLSLMPPLDGAVNIQRAGNISRLPQFIRGEFYVQDTSARLAAKTVGAVPGMNILDVCAAPGGKSFALAMDMKNRGSILSCDVSEKKLIRIDEGARRLGIDIIKTRAMDAASPAAELYESFDAVIADVPCSGLGVIRKKPEIRYKAREEINNLPGLQLKILRGAASCLKPGGCVVYSTCTYRKAENEDVIRAFLTDNQKYSILEERTIWPHIYDSDGFYICKLKKST